MKATVLAVVLLATGCARPQPKAPPPAPPASAPPPVVAAPPAWHSTAVLVQRPEVRLLVDALAASSQLSSDKIGYDAHRSAEWTKYEQLIAVATDAEMLALLEHESAVVRGYAVEHAATKDLESPLLDVLLTDSTPLTAQYGCLVNQGPLARVAEQSLCDHRDRPNARRRLLALAAGTDPDRARAATRCLALPR